MHAGHISQGAHGLTLLEKGMGLAPKVILGFYFKDRVTYCVCNSLQPNSGTHTSTCSLPILPSRLILKVGIIKHVTQVFS